MKNNRLFKGIICASLAALMAVSTCAPVFAAEAETNDTAVENTDMPNPFQECANMMEALEITGIDFGLPPFSNYTISAMNYQGTKQVIVRVPDDGDGETIYTKLDDKSYQAALDLGMEIGYKAINDARLNKFGITAYTYTENGKCNGIMWSRVNDSYGYVLQSTKGMDEETMIAQSLKVMAYNTVITGFEGDKSLSKTEVTPIPAQPWANGADLFLKESDVTVTYQGKKLTQGEDYYVRVFNGNVVGMGTVMIVPTEKSEFVGVKFAQFAVVPQAVTNVKYTDHTSTSVTLKFNPSEGAERYAAKDAVTGETYGEISAKAYAKLGFFTVKDLDPNTTYNLIVKPYFEEDGEEWYGPDSDVITTKTDTKALATPASVKNLKLAKTTKTSAQLSFSKSSGADGYAIFGFTSGKKYATVSTQKGASTLKKTITGLKSGKTYKFTVRPYKKINGKVYYGDTSKTVVVKITK
ncbi:MAG: fibronectin type III domain-containing protein [Oscillospiraceae bacterium]|nr:fibronectin type III domain-containing protein [Oscillospiraceae bacterium]